MRRGVMTLLFTVLVGCYVPGSLNPLHTDESLVAVPGLIGLWLTEDGEEAIIVARRDSSSYVLVSTSKNGETSRWIAWVTTLGQRRWLELQPEGLPDAWADDYRSAFLPLHYWLVLLEAGTQLRLASLVWDSLEVERELRPEALAHTTVNDEVVITADTDALRAFLEAYVERPGALEDMDPLWRAEPRR